MQFATLIRQLRTLRQPLQETNGRGRGSDRGGRRGGRGGHSDASSQGDIRTQEARQESALYREMLQIIRACITQVQRRCEDLTAAIENESPLLEERRVQFEMLNDRKEHLRADALAEREAEKGEPLSTEDLDNFGLLNEGDFNEWKDAKDNWLAMDRAVGQNLRDRATLASSLRGVLDAYLRCPAVQNLVKPQEQEEMENLLTLFCPVDEIFYASKDEMRAHYAQDLRLQLGDSVEELRKLRVLPNDRLDGMNRDALNFVKSVIPDPSMEQSRLSFVDELQNVVNQTSVMWGCDAKLVPFGSSINNFGSEGSDLDICLVLMRSGSRWPDALFDETPSELLGAPPASKAVEDLAMTLAENGFEDIDDSRKSARIPILQFRHGPLELECDICVDNRLAIRNTLLLRTYSLIDPRMRQLAYVVKTWAKKRKINNPAERTLSSYGYILLVIHYLQHLDQPMLPPLQALPPTWAGDRISSQESDDPAEDLPVVLVQSNNEGAQQNTYFYADPQSSYFASKERMAQAMEKLSAFAKTNTDSLAELMIGFFWTMAFHFDWRRHVIGIRDAHLVTKESKASEDSWKLHQRMAIEDPFETSYDVAHVVRDREFRIIREEFVRAYAVLTTASADQNLIELLCEVKTEE